jgi:diaminohydroxyphosphoribosylaminopyrimidine deaminase/5-amino-6-(5-phosphoribosylamino)uracil reductase
MEERRTSYFCGNKTVIDDNPKLDVRDWTGGNPVRIVLDQNSRLQKKSHVLDNQIKLRFTKTTTNDKENLTFTVIDFEKHSNSIDRCTV